MTFVALMLLPWLATLAGSMLAVRMDLRAERKQAAFLGFAAGVMVAASVWSLIIPALEGTPGWQGAAVATLGFMIGCAGMLVLDWVVPHQHAEEAEPEGHSSSMSRPMLLVIAVALHNIPEGVALGVVIAAALNEGMALRAALVFGLGLALQNMPEGMAVVAPLRIAGVSKARCARLGVLASLAEPAAALVGYGLSVAVIGLGSAVLTLMLSIAAGAMLFIVVEELIPASQAAKAGHAPTYGFLLGFWLMAVIA